MDLLDRIIKILQIPPSGCSRSFQSSDLLTLLTSRRVRSLLGDEIAREESLAAEEFVRTRGVKSLAVDDGGRQISCRNCNPSQ